MDSVAIGVFPLRTNNNWISRDKLETLNKDDDDDGYFTVTFVHILG